MEFFMSIIVSTKTYVPPPEGIHRAVIVDVINLGMVDGKYGRKHKVQICFELEQKTDDGRPFIITRTYNKSLHEKSALYRDLCAWRGKPFSREELNGFDLEKLIGVPCQVLIAHVERDGTVYGNVTTIIRAEKGKAYQPSGQYVRRNNHGSDDQEVADYDDSGPQDQEPSF
jgi:hypothetical protein